MIRCGTGRHHTVNTTPHGTNQVFLKVADVYFNGVANLDRGKSEGKFSGQLYGYGGNQTGVYRCGVPAPSRRPLCT